MMGVMGPEKSVAVAHRVVRLSRVVTINRVEVVRRGSRD